MNEHKNNKTFVIAILPSDWLLYLTQFILFGLGPLFMLFVFYQSLRAADFHLSLLLFLVFLAEILLGLTLMGVYYFFRNYVPYQIETDQSGMYYSSLMRRVHIRWDQIESLKIIAPSFTRGYFELRTKDNKLNIPTLMKEKENLFPRLDVLNNNWIKSDGSTMSVTAENCPLYIEIQQHIKK